MKSFCSIVIFLLLISCKRHAAIEGVYTYSGVDETIDSDLPNSVCSMVEEFEFRDGRCYYSAWALEMRVEYVIDNGVIYLNPGGVGISFHIIDKNTLRHNQCLFKLKTD